MIESNIIEWLDFGDSAQVIDIYSKKNQLIIFKFMRTLIKNKNFSIIIYIIFILLFFFQIWIICLINISFEKEFFLEILNYLKNIFVLFELVTNASSYKNIFIILFSIIIIDYILLIIVFYINKNRNISIFCIIINLLNIIIYYYLIGPVVQISLTSIWCENNIHKYLKITCFSNSTHIIYIVLSFIMLLLYLLLSFIYSFYFNEIESIKTYSNGNTTRIHCNYEIYCLISKLGIFIIGFFFYKMDYEEEDHLHIKLIFEGFIFINCLIMSIYTYKNVYFYDKIMNNINHFCWYFSSWFSLGILLKSLLNITGISNFIVIGWMIITFSLNSEYLLEENKLVTEENIFEFKNINSIEIYKSILLNKLSEKNNNDSKIFIFGIIKKFEEFANDNPEINYQFEKLLNNEGLNTRFNKDDTLPVLSIIYILYSFYYEKFPNKEEIVFHMCYFLINKLNNIIYAMLLCSKLKTKGYKSSFYKYLLSEDIKDFLISKLNKETNKKSLCHIQLGTIILYYLYTDLFKIKIYDALSNQIEYFDLLKNNITTNKAPENFLKCGNNIFSIRKEILTIWDKIIQINPFSDETYKDYMIYLESIIQDEVLAIEESKKYINLKNIKIKEKYNIYHRMFNLDTSTILLVDGYFSNGKILYSSPNFSVLFMHNRKELINLSIDDLLPNVVQPFHKELIEQSIKYSNIKYIFKKPRDSLLKNKTGGLSNIKLFVKSLPNLSYGLIYFTYIQKTHEPNFIILLDKELKVDGFTETSEIGSQFTMNSGFNLSQSILGYHIGVIIPDILLMIEFSNEEFKIIQRDNELKGNLYYIENKKDIQNKVDNILNQIKKYKKKEGDQEQLDTTPIDIKEEFNDLIIELNERKIKSSSIYYKIQLHTFMEGKYKYYVIFINPDILSENEVYGFNHLMNKLDGINKFQKKKKDKTGYKSIISKRKKETSLKIKLEEKNSKLKATNISTYSVNNKFTSKSKGINMINFTEKKENQNDGNQTEKKEKNINKIDKNNLKRKILIENNSTTNHKSKKISKEFNTLKYKVINKKEILPLRIMKYSGYILVVIIIISMIIEFLQQRSSFKRLTYFLSQNLYLSEIKINIGSLYTNGVNIRWLSHSLYINSLSPFNEEWDIYYRKLLEKNIELMQQFKTKINSNIIQFQNTLNERHQVEIYYYKIENVEKCYYNINNLFYDIFNNGIKLMDTFDNFIQNDCKEISKDLGLDEALLKNIIEHAFFFYNLDLKLYSIDEIREKNIMDKEFHYFPYSIILNGIIVLFVLFIFIYYVITIYHIEIFFLDKLINFTSIDFDKYIKQLEEIKKKLKNDNNDENDKEEVEFKDEEDVNEKNDNLGKKNSNDTEEINNGKKKDKNKKNRIQQKKRNKLYIMSSFFKINMILFQIKVILIFIISLTYYIFSSFINYKYKSNFVNFYEINESLDKIFKDSFDIFISLTRKLEIYENNLIDCRTIGVFEHMDIPKISNVNIPKFGNIVMKIIENSEFKRESMDKFSKLYENNACEILINYSNEMDYCKTFWSGVLLKGLRQAIVQMGVVLGTVLDELQALNDYNNKTLLSLISNSFYIEYSHFNQFYLFTAFNETYFIFNELREEKLNSILKKIEIILLIYIVVSLCLFILLIYFVYSFNSLFNSFLNFIGIFPSKYLIEDEKFYNEVISIGIKYY